MTLSFRHEVLRLGLRDPFLIARPIEGGGRSVTTVVIELRDDRFPDVLGLGEGYADKYYGETPQSLPVVVRYLIDAVGDFEPTAEGLHAASERIEAAIRWNGAAKCALDSALLDLVGKVMGEPAYRLLGLSPEIPPTDFTLGLDEPAVVAERAKRAGAFPALKIKVGGPADLATLEAVREIYDKPIRVDANTGWTPEIARQLLPALVDLGVELIEQPFPAGRLDWLRDLQCARHGTFAGKFALAAALQRGPVQPHAHPVGLRQHGPVLGGQRVQRGRLRDLRKGDCTGLGGPL